MLDAPFCSFLRQEEKITPNSADGRFNDHEPPHFHAEYGDYAASFSINDLKLICGKLPPRVVALVLEWANSHREELLDNWLLVKKGKSPKKIKPLV